jgi:hypothetical protein
VQSPTESEAQGAVEVADQYRASRFGIDYVQSRWPAIAPRDFRLFLEKHADDWPELALLYRGQIEITFQAALQLALVAPVNRALGIPTTRYERWSAFLDSMDTWFDNRFLSALTGADEIAIESIVPWCRFLSQQTGL